MKNIFILFTFFFTISMASAQVNCIEDFEGETPTVLLPSVGNWQTIAGFVAFENDITTNLTKVLRGNDDSGGSWMYNSINYGGDWLSESCEFCFDIRYVAGPNNPSTGVNAIFIYTGGLTPTTATTIARFQMISSLAIGNAWQQVCIPIELSSGSNLPANTTGQWVGPTTSAWDLLIQNVTGIAFLLDFGGGSNPVEDVYVDNLCFEPCPDTCAIVVDEQVICDTSGYVYTFSVLNNTGNTVDGIIINNVYNPSVSILPSGTYGPVTITIPANAYPTYCFDIIMFSDNLQCCHIEHCIDLPLCNPCDSIELIPFSPFPIPDGGLCCVGIDVINNFNGAYFTSIVSTILTPGVNFTNYSPGTGWAVTPTSGTVNVLTWTSGTHIALGGHGSAMNFCLKDIVHLSQTPQLIKFDWMVGDSVICSDTIPSFCEPCLSMFDEEVTCLPNGDYQFCFNVGNNDLNNTATGLYFDVYSPAGVQFSPSSFSPIFLPPNSGYSNCTTIPGSLVNPGDQVKFKIILKDLIGDTLNWCCIVDTFCITIPDCPLIDTCPIISSYNMVCLGDIDNDGLMNYQLQIMATGYGIISMGSSCGTMAPSSISVASATPTLFNIAFQNSSLCPVFSFGVVSILPNGLICFEEFFEIDFPPCPISNWSCTSLEEDVNNGFAAYFDCPLGIYIPNSLTSCDVVDWFLNGMYVGSSTETEPFVVTYPGEGDYVVCMSVERTDDTGQTCEHSICTDISITEWCPIAYQNIVSLKLAPNPSTDRLIISRDTALPFPSGKLSVTSINGHTVYQKQIDSEMVIQLDISTLATGMYIMSIEGESGFKAIERFIKSASK